MYKRNDRRGSQTALQWLGNAALIGVMLLVVTGVEAEVPPKAAPARPAPSKPMLPDGEAAPAVGGAYQLRCWQDGRLAFEENVAAIPPHLAGEALAMPSAVTPGATDYLLSTGNALCLLKPNEGTVSPH